MLGSDNLSGWVKEVVKLNKNKLVEFGLKLGQIKWSNSVKENKSGQILVERKWSNLVEWVQPGRRLIDKAYWSKLGSGLVNEAHIQAGQTLVKTIW